MTTITIQKPGKSPLHINVDTAMSVAEIATEIMHIVAIQKVMQEEPDNQFKWFRRNIIQKNLHHEETRIKHCEQCHAEIFPAANGEKKCVKCSKWSRDYKHRQLLKQAV